MSHLFEKASSFNEDIGGWAVDSVTSMYAMFAGASACNQDIGAWAVDSVTSMEWMFGGAESFDQDIGWCVDEGVSLSDAFSSTPCSSTSCGVLQGNCPITVKVMDDTTIRTAVTEWLSDATAAEATYGHISTWETGGGHGHV